MGPPGPAGPTGATGAGATGATGQVGGPISFPFTFSSTQTMSDPGSGFLRGDEATVDQWSQIAIDNVGSDSVDRNAFWALMEGAISGGVLFLLTIVKAGDPASFVTFLVEGATDQTGWLLMDVSDYGYGPDSTPFADSDAVYVQASIGGFPGAAGATGPVAPPVLPTVASVGTEFSSTGVPTATLPAGQAADDILLLLLQSSNDSNVTVAGYQQLGPQNAVGAASTAGTTKGSIFWKRSTGGGEVAPTIPDTGDHTYGVMIAIRGCPTVGDPFHMLGNAFKLAATTTGTSAKGATTVDNCLIMDVFFQGVDNASAQGSSPTNADLASVTEQFDDGTTDGTGGGIYVMTGEKAVAGPIGASTVTWANSTVDVSTRIAWLPDVDAVVSSPRPVEIQTFIGTVADLDDTWVKPTGARKVLAQICDGGGGASGGRAAATAAGGGGGGGGGYDEAWYNADDLGATATVHAGRGGAGGNADGAGNAGVVSEFDKGNAGPLTSTRRVAGTAATAAISADGGNGGCGSGQGTASPAVATTRININAATAGAAVGFVGGRGGSGTTAPTGGSPATWGGGGGESGGDTDASIAAANNGFSIYGAGGGGGGRTNTNVGGGGMGGGAAAVAATQGLAGANSSRLPYGGSGGNGGGSATPAGGAGGFPGGGGGGGGGVASGTGGAGGNGCVVVTTYF